MSLRKSVANDLRQIYGSATVNEAQLALESFSETWDKQYPTISKSWRTNWEHLIPFFDYPAEIRKVIYTTNAIESLNMSFKCFSATNILFPINSYPFSGAAPGTPFYELYRRLHSDVL